MYEILLFKWQIAIFPASICFLMQLLFKLNIVVKRKDE